MRGAKAGAGESAPDRRSEASMRTTITDSTTPCSRHAEAVSSKPGRSATTGDARAAIVQLRSDHARGIKRIDRYRYRPI